MILMAIVAFNGSHSLYVHSKTASSNYDQLVFTLAVSAWIAIIAGWVALVVSRWIAKQHDHLAGRRST